VCPTIRIKDNRSSILLVGAPERAAQARIQAKAESGNGQFFRQIKIF
jgi:hypothetical protein